MNFFSNILQHKKTLIFGVLFISIFFIATSIKAVEGTNCATDSEQCICINVGNCTGVDTGSPLSVFMPHCELNSDCITGDSGALTSKTSTGPDNAANYDPGWNVFKGVFVGFARLILWICWNVASWIGDIFSSIMSSWVQNVGITNPDATSNISAKLASKSFMDGWTSMRDLANMFIVLGFVVVGIAFTLRLEGYGTKKVLINLILVALLVNFSGLFCGLIIDASNIAFKSFTQGSGDRGISIVTALAVSGRAILTENYATSQTMSFVVLCLTYSILYTAVAITFIYMSIILMARYAILAMLYILSPVAFVFWVFPATKKLWTEWWNHFLKWCFVGVIGGFFLGIATIILPTIPDKDATVTSIIVPLIISLMFMIIGFKITAKSSGLASMASTAVMGLAAGAGGLALGAVAGGGKGGLKMLDKATGGIVSSGAQKVKSGVGRGMERLGLRQEGTTDTAVNKQVEEKAKLKSTAFAAAKARGDNATMDRIRTEARTGRGSERASAMQAIVDNKDLNRTYTDARGRFDAAAANAGVAYAQSSGAAGIREKAVRQSPTIEAHNNPVVAQIRHDHPGWTVDQARQEAVVRAAAKAPEDELDRDFVNSMDNQTLTAVTARMTDKKKQTLKANTRESLMQQIRSMPIGTPGRVDLIRKARHIISL